MARRRIDEGRRAGPAIQVLIGAADREIGPGAIEIDRHDAGAVAEVPDRDRALVVNQAGQRGHVAQGAGLVVDMVDQHDRGVLVDQILDPRGIDAFELQDEAGPPATTPSAT